MKPRLLIAPTYDLRQLVTARTDKRGRLFQQIILAPLSVAALLDLAQIVRAFGHHAAIMAAAT